MQLFCDKSIPPEVPGGAALKHAREGTRCADGLLHNVAAIEKLLPCQRLRRGWIGGRLHHAHLDDILSIVFMLGQDRQ